MQTNTVSLIFIVAYPCNYIKTTGVATRRKERVLYKVEGEARRLAYIQAFLIGQLGVINGRCSAHLGRPGASALTLITKRGELVTLPNVGLQLFDVVTVNDARRGIASGLYGVRGIEGCAFVMISVACRTLRYRLRPTQGLLRMLGCFALQTWDAPGLREFLLF